MPAWALYLGKVIASFVLLLIVERVSLPVYGLFNNLQWMHAFWQRQGAFLPRLWPRSASG